MRWSSFETRRLGTLFMAYIDLCPFCVSLGRPEQLREWAQARELGPLVWADKAPRALQDAAHAVVDGGKPYEGPVGFVRETAFQRSVLRATCAIAQGETRTYGEIAQAIGRPRAARAVGSALAANPLPLLIPCHRVVGAGRRLGYYSDGGPEMKRRLLAWEEVDLASWR